MATYLEAASGPTPVSIAVADIRPNTSTVAGAVQNVITSNPIARFAFPSRETGTFAALWLLLGRVTAALALRKWVVIVEISICRVVFRVQVNPEIFQRLERSNPKAYSIIVLYGEGQRTIRIPIGLRL